jgi:hypothetical protein
LGLCGQSLLFSLQELLEYLVAIQILTGDTHFLTVLM